MLAISERPPFRILLVVVALCGIGLLRHSHHHHRHWRGNPIAKLRDIADQQYRAKEFAGAEHTIRVAALYASTSVAEELHVVASFYHQLGQCYERGMIAQPSFASFHELEMAIQFDGMLGGALADELQQKRSRDFSTIGPE